MHAADYAEAGLAEYGYAALPPGHPGRDELRAAFLSQLVRHERMKRAVVTLVRAWRAAGIDAMLYKGFHLAEFVYDTPGSRHYGDVDIAVREGDIDRAVRIAHELGWTDSVLLTPPWSHAVGLLDPDQVGMLDLHRLLLHARKPLRRVQRRITAAVWSASTEVQWEGTAVRVPAPVDALLVGLILQRCWGADGWRLKPYDVLDYHLLTTGAGVSRSDLACRARELGCSGTLDLFMSHHAPGGAGLVRSTVTVDERRRWHRLTRHEHGQHAIVDRLIHRMYQLPRVVAWTLRVLPVVMHVRRMLGAGGALHGMFERLQVGRSKPRRSRAERKRIAYGVMWAFRLLPCNPAGDCLPRALALYAALRRAAFPAVFVSGVRRGERGIESHAWVELDGRVLDELGEPLNRTQFTPQFRWPPDEVEPPAQPVVTAGAAASRS
jgi:hypothetical protein